MDKVLRLIGYGCLLCMVLSAARAENRNLLPTARLAESVNTLRQPPSGTKVEKKRKAGYIVRDKINQFIVNQIEANPDITKEELQAQLGAILCPRHPCDIGLQPAVLTSSWFGPKGTLQFAVGYQIYLGFMGPNGMITVLESFLVENGKVIQRGAFVGGEFDAYSANFQLIEQFIDPAEIWVLAWGTVLGGSGRGIGGRAVMYRVGLGEVNVAWEDAREVNVAAQKSLIGWEFRYASKQLLYGNDQKPYFFDVYKIEFAKRTFSRTVHVQCTE